jgi:hypothetical protein
MRFQNFADVGIPLKNGAKPVLYHYRNAQIRPRLFENRERRCRKDAISHGANPDHRDSSLAGETCKDRTHAGVPLLLNAGFVD